MARFGGTRAIPEKEFTNAQAQFAAADTVRLAFAEAMIGNFDWCLKMTPDDTYRCDARHPLWNIVAAATDERQGAADHVRLRRLGYRDRPPPVVQGRLQRRVRAHENRDRDRSGRHRFSARGRCFHAPSSTPRAPNSCKRKGEAYRTLDQAGLDAGGRKIAQQYLDSFYRAIETDDAFYRPVVVAPNTRLFANENQQPACSAANTIPAGTPVSEPLQKQGTLVQVWLLDALWRWAAPVKCAAGT